jgi:Fe-S cluster biogenesis protein NfuA
MNIVHQLSTEDARATEDTSTLWIAFLTDESISKTAKTYNSSVVAGNSPLAAKLFGFPWVDEVKIAPSSIMVKRQDWVDFDIIAAPLTELIAEHFKNAESPIEENPEPKTSQADEPKADLSGFTEQEAMVISYLDQHVNPQVASHGGKISFVKLTEGSVHLKMEGGCQGCSSAQATLRDGVEKSLTESFDFIKEVVDTTDHDSGVKPYFG